MKKILSLLIVFTLVISLLGTPSVFAAEKILYEEKFESSSFPSGWSKPDFLDNIRGVKSEVTTKDAAGGSYSLHLTDSSDSAGNHTYTGRKSVVAGKNYALYLDVKPISGVFYMMLRFYTSTSATDYIGQKNATLVGDSTSWTTNYICATAPEGANYVEAWVYTNSGDVGEVYVDNLSIIEDYLIYAPVQADPIDAQIIAPAGDKLVYNTYNDKGDKLSDFSYAGYYAGNVELPDSSKLTQFQTVNPDSNPDTDVTDSLQTVLNNAAAKYEETGKMQVVTLKAGKYTVNKKGISLKSGIILKGEGQDPDGTVIYAKDAVQYNVIKAVGKAPAQVGDIAYVTDSYIPSGSKEITIEADKISDYQVGDLVRISHPNDDAWNKALDMTGENMTYTYPADDPVNPGKTNNTSWDKGEVDMLTERTITKIEGNKITIDFPLFVPYDTAYSKVFISKIDDSTRVHDIGIENLRVVSNYDPTVVKNNREVDEKHAESAIYFSYAKNCYVKDVSAKHFIYATVSIQTGSKQITVKNCSYLHPVSLVEGGRRYSFYTGRDTQQNLIIGCYSYDGRHDYCTSYTSTGPTVFTDSIVDEANSQSETHGTWSTGVLYDNIMHIGAGSGGYISTTNRGIMGTGLSQGWTGAGVVMWNSLSNALAAIKPPLTYQNFIVGVWGYYGDTASLKKKADQMATVHKLYKTNSIPSETAPESVIATDEGTPMFGDAYKEAKFNPVNPRSLYKAQLAERITGSINNAIPTAPVIISPRSDSQSSSTTIEVGGIYQKDATKVTVYVDNKAYNATLDSETNKFYANVTSSEGVHKVYATQTINGVEGEKTADRFVTLVSEGTRASYLSSDYNSKFASSIKNDTRITYDEYEKNYDNFKVNAPIDLVYGDSGKITVENAENYKNIVYNSMDKSKITVAADGTVTACDTGSAKINVTAEHTSGVKYQTSVEVNVAERPLTISSIDSETLEVSVANKLNGDVLRFIPKLKLETKGTATSVVSLQECFVRGEKAHCYTISEQTMTFSISTDKIALSGAGTEADPFIIDNGYKFENVFASFADPSLRTGNYYFLQTADIKIEAYTTNTANAFNGVYNAGSKDSKGNITYKNRKITFDTENYEFASLFGLLNKAKVGYINLYGSVKNTSFNYTGALAAKVTSSDVINVNNYATVTSGGGYVGGFAGDANGASSNEKSTFKNCVNYANITSKGDYVGGICANISLTEVNGCKNNGTIESTGKYVAGILGKNNSICKNNINNGTVKGGQISGGIIGYNNSSTAPEGCINYGTVTTGTGTAGGIVGSSYRSITKCANYGTIKAGTYPAGGIVGNIGSGNDSTVSECYNKGDIYAKYYAGGIAGRANYGNSTSKSVTFNNCFNAGTVTVTDAGTAGALLGNHSMREGLTVNCFYDAVTGLDTIATVTSYTYNGETYEAGKTTVDKAYIIGEGPYTYGAAATSDEVKALVTNGIFPEDVWGAALIYDYPILKNVLYDESSDIKMSGEYRFSGYSLIEGAIDLNKLEYANGRKPYGAYVIYAATFDNTIQGADVVEYGVLISKDALVKDVSELNMNKYTEKAVAKNHINGKYGILIYNSRTGLNGKYFVRPYVKYSKNGSEFVVYGKGEAFTTRSGSGLNHWIYSTNLTSFDKSVTFFEYLE